MTGALADRPSAPLDAAGPIRLGRVDYVNVLPVYLGLEVEGTRCTLVHGVPTELNARLRARDVDCAPVSAIEIAHATGGYAVLPGISISSVGAVGSSLLFSRLPPRRLDGATVALTTDSAASVALFQVLCARLWGVAVQCTAAAPDDMGPLGERDGMVLIGNPAIIAAAEAEGTGDVVVTDLGAAWFELTGLPAVFALWAVHTDWAARHRDRVAALRDDLERGRAWGLDAGHRETLCRRAAAETGLSPEAMDEYFRKQDYSLGDDHVRALHRYFAELAALGLAPAVERLELTW